MHSSPGQNPLSEDQLRKMKYESSEVDFAAILRMIGYLFVFLAVTSVVTIGIYNVFITGIKSGPMEAGDHVSKIDPTLPVIQSHPKPDMKDFRIQEEAKSEAYGWIDKNSDKARIPVDVEIDKIISSGSLPKAKPGGSNDPSITRKAIPVTETQSQFPTQSQGTNMNLPPVTKP